MFEHLPGLPLVLAAIALLPPFLNWRRGRALARAMDDPALPELLEAARRRNGSITAIAFAFLVVMSPGSLGWTIALLVVGHIVASYPLRKALYAETWTLGGYLLFAGRLAVAIWGFWLLLALLPLQAPNAGRLDWLVALIVSGVLVIWNARADVVLRRMLGSRPLEDPELLARFKAVAERSNVAAPNFEWVPLGGGAISNAIALPALPRSSVLFTETLLSHMDADEAAAICAHEIAHLEHHTPRVLRRITRVHLATIATGAVFAVLPRLAGWESTMLTSVLWVVVLFAVIAWRAHDRQKHETARDVRAVALTGDAEALVRALTKLYTFARMPRRIDADMERRATHPSLARRIRDIRAAAGTAPAALGETSIFSASDGAATVTFDNDRLHWAEGNVATHSLSYSQFSELRLQVTGTATPSLLAVQRDGRRWHASIAPADIPRLQAVLDIVDGRLAADARVPATFGNLARVVAGFAAAFGLIATQIGMAVAALMALLQPSTPTLAGAGVASLASAIAALRSFEGVPGEFRFGLAAMLALLGVGLLGAAYTRRGDRLPPRMMLGIAFLGLCAAFCTSLLLWDGINPVQLHLSARSISAAAVFLLALGTTLVCMPRHAFRYAALPLLVGGATALGAGSPVFLDTFGRDPFLEPAPPISWTTVTGSLQGESHAPFYTSMVELSPSGRALIVQAYDATEHDLVLHVGRLGEPLSPTSATHLLFIDDDRLLGVYGESGGAMEIRETPVDAPETITWRRPVPEFAPHALSYDAATRTWNARGVAEDGTLLAIQGDADSTATRESRWPSLGVGRVAEQTAASADALLVHERSYVPSVLQRRGWWQLMLLMPGHPLQSRFSRLTTTSRADAVVTRLQANCLSAAVRDALLCTAFDGTRTRFAAIDAKTANVTPLTWLPGRFTASVVSSSGWLSGWADWRAVAIRPTTREGIRFDEAPERLTQLTATERAFAAVSMAGGESTIRVYTRSDAQRAAR